MKTINYNLKQHYESSCQFDFNSLLLKEWPISLYAATIMDITQVAKINASY
jgi:hypothetical protein